MFTNDLYPNVGVHVEYLQTIVKRWASIGTNATIIAGITIGEYSVVGAGSVVTKDIPPFSIAAGNPARVLKQFNSVEEIQNYFRSKQKIR